MNKTNKQEKRCLPCPNVRIGLEILRTVLVLEQRTSMAGKTVGDQSPHLSPPDESGLKHKAMRIRKLSMFAPLTDTDIENGMNSYLEHL